MIGNKFKTAKAKSRGDMVTLPGIGTTRKPILARHRPRTTLALMNKVFIESKRCGSIPIVAWGLSGHRCVLTVVLK